MFGIYEILGIERKSDHQTISIKLYTKEDGGQALYPTWKDAQDYIKTARETTKKKLVINPVDVCDDGVFPY